MINNMPNGSQAVNSGVSFSGLAQFAKGTVLFALLIFSAALFSPGVALAADATGTLSIQASGFAHQRGHAIANLFCKGDDVLKLDKAYQHAKVEIHDGKATFSFPGLPYGKYAVSVFHDENDNGMLDHNALHFPAEPLGFSNHFQLGIFSGFPSFEKLQFQFAADTGALEITVK